MSGPDLKGNHMNQCLESGEALPVQCDMYYNIQFINTFKISILILFLDAEKDDFYAPILLTSLRGDEVDNQADG